MYANIFFFLVTFQELCECRDHNGPYKKRNICFLRICRLDIEVIEINGSPNLRRAVSREPLFYIYEMFSGGGGGVVYYYRNTVLALMRTPNANFSNRSAITSSGVSNDGDGGTSRATKSNAPRA